MNGDGASVIPVGSPRARWAVMARVAFALLACVAALALIVQDRVAIAAALARADPALLAVAQLVAIGYIMQTWVSWRMLLVRAPDRLSWAQSARAFFLGQMGKYVPGSVWSFLATGELAYQAGLSRATGVSSLMLAVLIGLGSGAMLALAIVPDAISLVAIDGWVAVLLVLPAGILAWPRSRAFILRRARIDFPVPPGALIASCAVATSGWLFAGLLIALIAQALGHATPPGFVMLATGSYALAWTAGFLFFAAPAGLGAREGVLVVLLAAQMPLLDAIVAALLARVLVTVADIVLALCALTIRPTQGARAAA